MGLSSKKSAFTLIEIILVVLLLSVIAGLTIPNFRNSFRKVKLQNSANNIAYLMR
ncbi:MAG: prepilin-type N-terminal cleavage/methylation domain-containing protein, partial [Candidatus Omnitrophica bacterium]|nr:prepilin-type N-terminal cleavage/methylation domain-containing protein [Candidatus Omnitrophota bacterium]